MMYKIGAEKKFSGWVHYFNGYDVEDSYPRMSMGIDLNKACYSTKKEAKEMLTEVKLEVAQARMQFQNWKIYQVSIEPVA